MGYGLKASGNLCPAPGTLFAAPGSHCLPPPPPPRQVRVFSIQRVSKSWNARSECIRRTYSYYLPAAALGLALDGGQHDAQRLALLAAAWQRFEGTHPFHNYTKRRLYREGEGGAGAGGRRRKSRAERDAEAAAGSEPGSEGSECESDSEGGACASAPAAAAAGQAPADGADPPSAAAGGGPAAGGEGAPVRKGQVKLQWKAEKDLADLVVRRHFR